MKKDEAIILVIETIKKLTDEQIIAKKNTKIINDNPIIDSMKLIEICIELEDIAEEHGFIFDWTSEATMSNTRSMFRDVNSLSEEFAKQSENKK